MGSQIEFCRWEGYGGANGNEHGMHAGHGAMPGTKKMPDLDLILKVVMPSDPTFHFRIYVYSISDLLWPN